MAPDAMADHVRHQYQCPHHLLHHAVHLPDAHHPGRQARVPGQPLPGVGPPHGGLRLHLLLGGKEFRILSGISIG